MPFRKSKILYQISFFSIFTRYQISFPLYSLLSLETKSWDLWWFSDKRIGAYVETIWTYPLITFVTLLPHWSPGGCWGCCVSAGPERNCNGTPCAMHFTTWRGGETTVVWVSLLKLSALLRGGHSSRADRQMVHPHERSSSHKGGTRFEVHWKYLILIRVSNETFPGFFRSYEKKIDKYESWRIFFTDFSPKKWKNGAFHTFLKAAVTRMNRVT